MGSSRYQQGSMGTAKGFTGQYNDSVSGLDYYGSRYYDPVVGRFLSADVLDGNLAGMDPYAYVGGNPETFSDPTGQFYAPPPGGGGGGGDSQNPPTGNPGPTFSGPPPRQTHRQNENPGPLTSDDDFNPVQALEICVVLGPECVIAAGAALLSVVTQPAIKLDPGMLLIPNGVPFRSKSSTQAGRTGDTGGITLSLQPQNNTPPSRKPSVTSTGSTCSFTSNTSVTTSLGEEPIGKLHIGEQVLAYNPKTGKMEQEPILHVWINHDHDLVDLTITTITKGEHGKPATKTSEVVHTNQKHPFLTLEQGFLPVGKIKLGMHVLRADGRVGVVTGWKVVPGTEVMYNLEVAQDHTFTVGNGQWVVHNDCRDLAQKARTILNDLRKATPTLRAVTTSQILDPLANEIIGVSGTQARLYIEGADVVKDVNNARCGELICIQDVIIWGDTSGSDTIELGMAHWLGEGPCPDCYENLQTAATQLGKIIRVGWEDLSGNYFELPFEPPWL
jgi:RHS repeat-associated protein